MLSKEKIKPGSMIHLPDIDYMGDGEGKQKKIMREYCENTAYCIIMTTGVC